MHGNWNKPMQDWLAKHYGKTPEQVEALNDEDFDNFVENLIMDECKAGDTEEANLIADIVDAFWDDSDDADGIVVNLPKYKPTLPISEPVSLGKATERTVDAKHWH